MTNATHRSSLFDDTIPTILKGMRGFFVSNPGTGKTILLNWLAYIAALGGKNTLILDGESPYVQIERNLNRYSLHYGTDWTTLPLTVRTVEDFNWSNLDREDLTTLNPDFVIVESIQSMSGNTNDPNIGGLIRRSLNRVHANVRWCLVSAHTNQASFYLTRSQLEELPIPELARIVKGDTGIVSQGCDVAYLLKQLSNEPLRIAIIVKSRRGYLQTRTYYYELKEPDGYGNPDTPMWWEGIAPVRQELDKNCLDILRLVRTHLNSDGEPAPISAKEIMNMAVTIEQDERRGIINLLVERRDIIDVGSFSYIARTRQRIAG